MLATAEIDVWTAIFDVIGHAFVGQLPTEKKTARNLRARR
jgi:hypothetical protein